jgi:nicotinamidase-related amidase
MQEGVKVDYTRPDFGSMALITIDMQQDFLDGQPFEIAETSEILPRLQRLAAAFRRTQLPIVHMVRLYKRDGSNADRCRRRAVEQGAAIVSPGTAGAELTAPLLPGRNVKLDPDLLFSGAAQQLGPKEWVLYKPRWGAFFGTSLDQHLLALGVTSLAFTGCTSPTAHEHQSTRRANAIFGSFSRKMRSLGYTIAAGKR